MINVTIHPISERTFWMRAFLAVLRLFRGKLIKPPQDDAPSKREWPKHEWSSVGSPRLNIPTRMEGELLITERSVDDIWCYDVDLKSKSRDNTSTSKQVKRVFYFAGGAFQMAAGPPHWSLIAEIVRKTPNCRLTLISWPLGKHANPSTAIPNTANAYLRLLSESALDDEHVILMGDSAGGNIATSVALYTLRTTPPSEKTRIAPNQLCLISPVMDCVNDNPEMEVVDKVDPVVTAETCREIADKWRADVPATDPIVSPVRADLSVLAEHGIKVNGIIGTWDVLAPDAMKFMRKCDTSGVSGDWYIAEGQMHCFPLAWGLRFKNSIDGKNWILRTLREESA
ncbi:uncharacterized protein IL334_004637 [Kwoniella shivajii]|uniref:Alpha/beta hydrolase fold-3 domain-containing protein n=1 Tax=Kwoniella shivajii TaxID=564305 RepID=A0ABZ1D197_9TREE|nr:hypothetical protein IL334_004637 [Kwoniella shivajii]